MAADAPTHGISNDDLEVFHEAPGRCAFARFGNLTIQLWFGRAAPADAVALSAAADRLHARYPQGVSTMHWMLGMAELPDAETRHLFAELLKRHGEWFGEVGMVVEGEGFWLSAVRAMLTGLRMAAGARVGFRVGRTIDDVLAWLPEHHWRRTGVKVTAAQLEQVLEQLARDHRPHEPRT